MSLTERKNEIITHLMTCYNVSEQQANPVYDQTVSLFHELSTIIDLSSLLTMDKKIISSLVVFIM
jgi:hypothetical protein